MTTSKAIAVEMPGQSDYGAAELKQFIRKYTLQGFIITVALFIIIMLLYFLFVNISASDSSKAKIAPIVKLRLEDLPPPDNNLVDVPPPPTQEIIHGTVQQAGTPVAAPTAEIAEDFKYAPTDLQDKSLATSGTEIFTELPSDIDLNAKVDIGTREHEPEPDEFISVEKEPGVNMDDLQKLIVYPDLARRAGVEGKVIIRVLIDKNGKVKKTLVEYSDNELLNEAALKAIREYKAYTPAIQNRQPVACWLSIPIQFRIR